MIFAFHDLDERLAAKLRRLRNVRILRIRENASPNSCGAKVQTSRVDLNAPALAAAVIERNTVQDYLAFEGEGILRMQRIYYVGEYSPERLEEMQRFLARTTRHPYVSPARGV
jgi:hypothetical protein